MHGRDIRTMCKQLAQPQRLPPYRTLCAAADANYRGRIWLAKSGALRRSSSRSMVVLLGKGVFSPLGLHRLLRAGPPTSFVDVAIGALAAHFSAWVTQWELQQ